MLERLKENLIENSGNIKSWADHNSPAILFGTGIALFGLSLYSMYKDAPKCKYALADARIERSNRDIQPSKPMSVLEDTGIVLKNMWKEFLLAAGGVACLYSCYKIQDDRMNVALCRAATTYEAYKIYKETVKEELNEKDIRKIEEKVVEKKINNNPEQAREVIITKPGEMLFKDDSTGRYFASSIDELRRIENELNRRVYIEMFVEVNQLYDELGLSHVKLGREMGWTTDNPPRFSMEYAELAEDKRPCCLLEYDVSMRSDPW